MAYDLYRDGPLGYLAEMASDPSARWEDQFRARRAILARLGELASDGWLQLGYDGRVAILKVLRKEDEYGCAA